MIICHHQPNYLPGLQLFNKISLCDGFMFLDHVQFVNRSWQCRNKIYSPNGELYLTVPVSKAQTSRPKIMDAEIAEQPWKKKHLKSMASTYGKKPFFNDYFPQLEAEINKDWQKLSDMNIALTKLFLGWLNIETEIFLSSQYDITGQKNDMLISACKAVKADEMVSNQGSRDYVDEQQLLDAGIKHNWQEFTYPNYDQHNKGKEFQPHLSVVDLLFNMGEQSGEIVKTAGHISRQA